MATATRRPGRSFSDERHLIKLAKTLDFQTIVKRTGRKPAALLKMAKRLGVSLKPADRIKPKRQ
jgi:hypothetical protein